MCPKANQLGIWAGEAGHPPWNHTGYKKNKTVLVRMALAGNSVTLPPGQQESGVLHGELQHKAFALWPS